MTEGQIRYQQVVENQRHNLAMEQLGHQEIDVKKRETKIREAQEARNVELFPFQKRQVIWSLTGTGINNLLGGAKFVDTTISATRNLFGLFGDAAKFASNVQGAGGGYYQGSLFA